MVNRKDFLKKPKAPKKTQVLVTADDFQEAADIEEETGGKWRAGDQAKSSRAFLRAIQIYNDGLQKHPKDADLAYNKARLEFELSQQPGLVSKLPVSPLEFLQQALASHRYALRLNEESADVLFNTAQVMISIAEYMTDAGMFSAQADSVQLLHEAIELLSACFSRQEMLVEEQRANSTEEEPAEGGISLDQLDATQPEASSSSSAAEKGDVTEYATVEAFVTPSDLLDTARSSLTALTLLITLDAPGHAASLSKMGQTLIEEKIPTYLSQVDMEERAEAEPEIALSNAEFMAALANADFKVGSSSVPDCLSRLQVFEALDLDSDVAVICTYADALVDLVTTIQTFSSGDVASLATTCWTQLTKAQDLYNRAVKINDDETKARKALIYESRADVELLRFNLATSHGTGLPAAVAASAPTLVKNAQTYYRGAANLFRNDANAEASAKAEVRGLVAAVLEGKLNGRVAGQAVAALQSKGESGRSVAVDMMRESLLPENWDEGLA